VGRVVDGPVELGFNAWDLDHFGERDVLPFHVRLSLEGIPHHVWNKEVADNVLGDEAFIIMWKHSELTNLILGLSCAGLLLNILQGSLSWSTLLWHLLKGDKGDIIRGILSGQGLSSIAMFSLSLFT
jgi:hypothetical protein